MKFDISRESVIYVYGGGALGRSYFSQLSGNGFHVKGIIDRNADKIENKNGIPYYTTSQYSDIHTKDDVVIVCVHNALWHAEIVDVLKPLGVENVLFVPLSKEYGRLKSNEMMKAYNHFVNREYEQLNNIPTISSLCDKGLDVKKAILHETQDFIVCWIDITSLYTSESVAYATKRHAPKELEKFADTPMPGMLPYVMLFRMLAGQTEGEGESFVKLCKRFQNSIDEYSDEEFLYDRFDLYNELNTQLNFGIGRFIDSAPDCVWNKKGFFNLLDGMSRTTFLYSKGFQFVPVKMKRDEFEFWSNQIVVDEVAKVLPPMTNWEIEHPAFIEYPAKNPGMKRKVMTAIEEYFNSKKWDGTTIIDYTATDGCLARYFARQGAMVVRYVEEEELAFEAALSKMFRIENSINLIQNIERLVDVSFLILSVTRQNIGEAQNLIGYYDNVKFLCLYHNLDEDVIDGFEKELNEKPRWKNTIKGRKSITICIYR